MNCIKNYLSVYLAVIMMLAISVNSFAVSNNSNSIASVNHYDNGTTVGVDATQSKITQYANYTEAEGDTTAKVNVYATQASTYTATIPAVLIVDGAYNAEQINSFAYDISVVGNIAGNEKVTIDPEDTFTMSSVGKDDINGTITQAKTDFAYSDGMRIDTPVSTTGSGSVSGMTAGLWLGSFNFDVSLKYISDLITNFNFSINQQNNTFNILGLTSAGRTNVEETGVVAIPSSAYVTTVNEETIYLTAEKINANAFTNNKNIKKVVVANTVREIGESAFEGCTNLKSLEFESGSTLKRINYSAFNLTGIMHLSIPSSVEELGILAFGNQRELRSLNFESGSKLREISNSAFCSGRELDEYRGNSLGTIIIPKSVEKIAYNAFYATLIDRVVFEPGSKCKTIESRAFDFCFTRTLDYDSLDENGIKMCDIIIPNSCTQLAKDLFTYSLPVRVGIDNVEGAVLLPNGNYEVIWLR